MPQALEKKLKKEVAGKNWSKERKNAYVFGTMRKTGWTPAGKKKKKSGTLVFKEKKHGH